MALNLTGSDMDMPLLLLISGPVAVGKSAIACELVDRHGFQIIRSGAYLAELAARDGRQASRVALQQLGDALDEQTDYRWLIDDVTGVALHANPDHMRWLLDCVRKKRQVEHFRTRFNKSVVHVHLTAMEPILRDRYMRRLSAGAEYIGDTAYEAAIAHPNEICARALIAIADFVLDVSQVLPPEAAAKILARSIERARNAASCFD
jgi:hypothetical protein